MRRAAAWFLTAAVAITAAVAVPGPAAASDRSDAWASRARMAITQFRDNGAQRAYTYAAMAEAYGRLTGWGSDKTAGYLATVYALQQTDGGWGIGEAYDAFGDGSVNPADTTYTVTLADHIGPALLAGYQAGVVPRARVQQIVDQLVALPRIPVTVGQCVAYSDQPADGKAGMCVHNVNAGVGSYLQRAAAAEITAPGVPQLVADITAQEQAAYQQAPVSWWPYSTGGPALQDADHEAYSAQSMALLSPAVGREAGMTVMATAFPDEPDTAPLAHMRLTSTPGPGWCEAGDRWLREAYDYVLPPLIAGRWRPPPPPAMRMAQAALFSARNAAACA